MNSVTPSLFLYLCFRAMIESKDNMDHFQAGRWAYSIVHPLSNLHLVITEKLAEAIQRSLDGVPW